METIARALNAESVGEDEDELLLWAALARLPSQKRTNFALLRRTASESDSGEERTEMLDVRKLDLSITSSSSSDHWLPQSKTSSSPPSKNASVIPLSEREHGGFEQERIETFARASNDESVREDEDELLWAALARLPSQKRTNFALLRRIASESDSGEDRTETVDDFRKLDRLNRKLFVKRALATSEQDNYKLLSAIKKRLAYLNRFAYIPSKETPFNHVE
ncbi:hypothetical protein Acr_15g0002170 [Actinidia rufa]|uniref:Uncharacterized protein n=1 Tax=Actinidia rufa TaxID=165716 RepID=A0A7J0FUK7_9ERIC|nr:hypothetical protein Acr_15g0002170 [Actinidia rufa]